MTAPETPLDDQQWTRREVRSRIRRLGSAAARAKALLHARDRLAPPVRELVAELTRRQAEKRLHDLPIAELRPHLKPGTRLGVIEKDGFGTVAAVFNASGDRLAAIKGVSPATADQVREAAIRVRDGVAAQTRFRFDPDHRDDTQELLLAHLAAIRAGDRAARTLLPGIDRLVESAEELVAQAKPVAGLFRRMFARPRTKRAAFAAVARIDRELADTAELVDRIDRATRETDPRNHRAAQLWTEYGRNAAAVNSVLAGLESVATEDDQDSERGHIGAELADRVAHVALNTRLVTADLRGYQHFGAQFALERRRAILGDEMGLGKTVQALVVAAHLAASGNRHTLVICPASVLLNWLAEAEAHTGLDGHRLHGDGRDDAVQDWRRHGGVGVTTFDTLPRLGLDDAGIDLLVVDEAHYLKNSETKRAQAITPFIDRSGHTLFLSGTPMENRIGEFRTLVRYLNPRVAERLDAFTGMAGAREFRRAVAEVYLRRNQSDVLSELPGKIEIEDWVPLTAGDIVEFRRILFEPGSMGRFEKLRHAAYRADDSAKLGRVIELIREASEDELKVVVFSRYLDVLGRIESGAQGTPLWKLTGKVPPGKRQALIDEFSDHVGPAVLLAQIDTGGTGINLQQASVAIITEPQWKPSAEQQAIARLHRMGQVRAVQVHRILAKDSVDDALRMAQERKTREFDAVARESDAKDADRRAVDASSIPAVQDDVPAGVAERIIQTERARFAP